MSAIVALTLSMAASRVSAASVPLCISPTGSETGLSGSSWLWQNWWGGAYVNMTWDSATIDPLTSDPQYDGSGSVYHQATWPGGSAQDDMNVACAGNWWGGLIFDATKYSSIELDFKYDTTSTITPATAPHLIFGFSGSGGDYTDDQIYTLNITNGVGMADGNWHHLSIPYSAATLSSSTYTAIETSGGVVWYQWNPAGTSGTMNYWLANIYLVPILVAAAPPTVTISNVVPGLHFVAGTISGQYDRQNIITARGATSNALYLWTNASAGSPVTYSFNISQFTAPDLNYHIYFYDTAGAGGASAPDYNQPDVLIFQVSPASNNTAAVATLLWKTNTPAAGTPGNALQITNNTLTGLWQLQFTSASGGNVIPPGGSPAPFTLDAGLVANLSATNPITVNFGINPASDASSVVGEEVVITQVSITGVDPLAAAGPHAGAHTDNFLLDSSLDTNAWTVNAMYPGSLWFVAANDVYSVDWTIPDTSFALAVSTSLSSLGTGTILGLPDVALPPGERTLIPSSSLPAGPNGYFYLINRTYTNLLVALPGQTVTTNGGVVSISGPPTTLHSGVSGSPPYGGPWSEPTATAYAVDANNILVTTVNSGFISLSCPGDTVASDDFDPPANSAPMVNGVATFTSFSWGNDGLTGPVSETVTVNDSSRGFSAVSAAVELTQ